MDPAAAVTADPGGLLTVRTGQRFAGGFNLSPSLEVELLPGSMLVLFGPSGAGKTTILRQIAGLERPDEGTIRFGADVGCDVARQRWRPPQERRVGVVFQEPTLFPHLTVRDNIRYGLGHRGRISSLSGENRDPTRVAALLGVADLENRYPRALSGGEAQRIALARALAPGPRLLLLDEPFAALDAPARLRLRRDVRTLLHTTGTPAVFVTHDRMEALAMGDAVAVVIGGRVRQIGPVSDVFSRPSDIDVAASLGIEAVLPGRVVGSSGGVYERGPGIRIGCKVRAVTVDEDEIGPLACLDRPDFPFHPERTRPLPGGHAQDVPGGQRARPLSDGLEGRSQAHFLEHVEPVVAGGAVGSE